MPFSAVDAGAPAKVQLEQVDPHRFVMLQAFRYVDPAGRTFVVTPEILGPTDLTSVPFGFRWFVNTYGRHTLPALLHDCLINAPLARRALQHGVPPDRQAADNLFLLAMGEQGVPVIRRHLMWSAVTFNTRFTHLGWLARIGMIVWTLAALAGTALLYRGTVAPTPDWVSILAGVAGPLPFAVVWGRSRWAGLWFGYGIALLLPAALVVHVSYLVYWCTEHLLAAMGLSTRPPTFRHF